VGYTGGMAWLTRIALPMFFAGAIAACSITNMPDDPVPPSTSSGAGGTGGNGGTGGTGGNGGAGGGGAAECGDGIQDPGEDCDDSGASATCDDDCTSAECGDDTVNTSAGEECDAADAISSGCCDATACTFPLNCAQPIDIPLTDDGTGQFSGAIDCPLGGASEVLGACDGAMDVGGGGEQVFHFNLPVIAQVQINVSSDFDAALRLMTMPCDVSSEIPEMGPATDGCANQAGANADETLSYPFLLPGNYFVVVDGVTDQDAGDFNLTVATQPALNPIINPSFEAGNYMGWTLSQQSGGPNDTLQLVQPAGTMNPGQMYVDLFDNQSGSSGSPALPFQVTPSDGALAAVWLSDGPDTRRMYQTLVVTGPMLQFDMAHFNSDAVWLAGSQQIAIHIRDPASDTILATPFVTNGAFPLTAAMMITYNVDVSAFLGQMVRLDVEVQGQNFFLDAVFDNFVIL
jgi:hypothetical protein